MRLITLLALIWS